VEGTVQEFLHGPHPNERFMRVHIIVIIPGTWSDPDEGNVVSAMHILIRLTQNGKQMHLAVGQVRGGKDGGALPPIMRMRLRLRLVCSLDADKEEFR